MQKINRESTSRMQTENEFSNEEMSYSEMYSHFLGEFVPGRGRIATCGAILCLFMIVTLMLCRLGWNFYCLKPKSDSQTEQNCDANMINAQNIRLVQRLPDGTLSTNKPAWITEDLRVQIFERLSREGCLCIHEEAMFTAVENALKGTYWLKEIRGIRKFYPTCLEIEVVYQKPALLVVVQVNSNSISGADGNGETNGNSGADGASSSRQKLCYVPLSEDCRILPMDPDRFPVSSQEREGFPHFCGKAPPEFYETNRFFDFTDFEGYPMPANPDEGVPLDGDPVIKGAIKLVALLGPRWKTYGFAYICLEERLPDNNDDSPEFCIVTRNGSRIHWGISVTKNNSKSDTRILDSEKLAQLDKIFRTNGKLDSAQNPLDISFRHESPHEKQNRMHDRNRTENPEEMDAPLTPSQSVGETKVSETTVPEATTQSE